MEQGTWVVQKVTAKARRSLGRPIVFIIIHLENISSGDQRHHQEFWVFDETQTSPDVGSREPATSNEPD